MAVKTLTLPKLESGDNHFFRCCGIINQKMSGRKTKPKLANNLTFFLMSYYNIFKIFVCGRFILKTSYVAEGVNAKNN